MFINLNGHDVMLGFVDESTPGGIALSEFNTCMTIAGPSVVHLRLRVRLDHLVIYIILRKTFNILLVAALIS